MTTTRGCLALTLLGLSFLVSHPGLSEEREGVHILDLSAKAGLAVGNVTRPQRDDNPKKTFLVGGLPMFLTANYDLTQKFSVRAQAQLMLEFNTLQVVKTGGDMGLIYSLIGGSRRVVQSTPYADMVSRNVHNLGIAGYVGYYTYSYADEKDEFQGATLEFKLGMEYQREWDETSAYGGELLFTPLSLATSTEGLSYSGLEIVLFWRMFI